MWYTTKHYICSFILLKYFYIKFCQQLFTDRKTINNSYIFKKSNFVNLLMTCYLSLLINPNATDLNSDTYMKKVQTNSNIFNNQFFFFLQASTIDGRRKGACLFCQEYFMELYLLAELKTISLKVTTVDMQKPPPDFRTNFEATPPPILIDRGMAILENEKIERHIMKNVPGGHNLFVQVNCTIL